MRNGERVKLTPQDPCYTDPVANLTLSLPDELLKQARRKALEDDTSVNAVVREFLAGYVGESDAERRSRAWREFLDAGLRSTASSGDWKWNRDELYEERLGRFGAS